LTSRAWLGLFSVVVLAAVVLVALTHPDLTRQFTQNLATLSFAPLATAFLLILAQVGAQAMRFWAIIPRDSAPSPLRAAYIFTVGDWTNIFFPARGGDALKVLLLTRPGPGQRASLTKATGAMLADKVVDVTTLIILCTLAGLTSLLLVRTRAALPSPGVILGAGAVLGLLLAWAWRSPSSWIAAAKAGLRDVLRGQSALKHPVWFPASMSFSAAARALEISAMGVLCGAMGFPLSAPQLLLALFTVNLSTVVPVSFASLGVYEAGLTYGLTRSGVPLPAAITIATTHHALELLGITLSAAGYTLASRMELRRAGAGKPLLDDHRPAPPGEVAVDHQAGDERQSQ
jgi:uncharacterized membrane protein YbhN (UPF0104 family)